MRAAEPRPCTRPPEPERSLLEGFSIETTARPKAVADVLDTPLPPRTSVYITALPGVGPADVIAAAGRLRQAGFNPVPHLGARYFASRRALDALLDGLAAAAQVSQALVIAGDRDRAEGPFASALDLLRCGALARHGIARVGLAGYPEGHPRIPAASLDAALSAKVAAAREAGMTAYLVTQFCFAAEPIRRWLERSAVHYPDVPRHVGLAGPAGAATLIRYGLACGIGPSLRTLRRNAGFRQLLGDTTPLPILRELVRDPAARARIAQVHFFPFGGIGRTARWIASVDPRRDLEAREDGVARRASQ